MSTPADQMPQGPASPLDEYMQNYGSRLQSLLAGDPNQGQGDSALDSAGATSNLGPDPAVLGRPPAQFATPQAPPQSALDQGAEADQGKQGGVSFRDLWEKQSQKQREQYIDKLQNHLKATDQSIDSAYKTMVDQLGARPDTKISKEEKGMLLMEFGMRMMEHSRSVPGQPNDTASAFGQAGVETLQSARGLQQQKIGAQQRYDQLRQGLTIAQGKEKAQLASRSALEEGRDVRALGAQNASLVRTEMQQKGAGERSQARNQALMDRVQEQEQGKNTRASMAAGQVKRTVTGEDGSVYGVTGTGKLVQLGKDGQPIKAAPGGAGGAGRQTAAQANYNLYLQTYGKDADGKPLEGEELQQRQREALAYAANPRSFQLSDAQMRQMAQKSADNYIRTNQLSWAGMNPDEIAKKQAAYAETEYQRLKSGGSPGDASSLAPPRARAPSPPASSSGLIPTKPVPGKNAAGPKALEILRTRPDTAKFFFKTYGYLPPEYHKYLKGTASALE